MSVYLTDGDVQTVKKEIAKAFEGCCDVVLRNIKSGDAYGFICCFKNVTDRRYASEMIVAPLMTRKFKGDFDDCVLASSLKPCKDVLSAVKEITNGAVVCFLEYEKCLYGASIPADAIKTRSIGEPNSDVSIKGPKVGFVESIDENVAQLRKMIRTGDLKTETFTVGTVSKTPVAVVYVEGRAEMKTVEAVKRKLRETKITYAVDSGNIEMIFEKGRTRFLSMFGSTEKADKAASKLLSGRVAVICDGSPFVLTAPNLFFESLQSTDDYLRSPYYSSFIRVLRSLALIVSLVFPAAFIAVMNFHKEIIPKEFLDTITEKEEGIPFSAGAEVLIMLLAFEIIREVGVRMPRTVGDTVGIVASLILGDAAVEAGIASPVVIIVVAASAVCAFVVPSLINAVSILRLLYFFSAFAAGFFGLGAALLITVVSLVRKKSFGVSYLYPLYPFKASGLLDTFVCIPRKVLGRKELN